MKTEDLIAACIKAYDTQDKHTDGLMAVIIAVEKAMREDGYVKLPAEWYIAEDGDGDAVIWRPTKSFRKNGPECIGYRFMAGNGRIEKPVADWLWENIRKGES